MSSSNSNGSQLFLNHTATGHYRICTSGIRGMKRVDQHFKLTMTASNIVRMARIMMVVPQEVAR